MVNKIREEVTPVAVKSSLYLVMSDELLSKTISLALPDSYVIQNYSSADDLLRNIGDELPDIIVCHDTLINDDGTVANIKTLAPTSRILVLGEGRTIVSQIALLKQGARGYFDSSLATIDKLHFALQNILHGEVWVDRHLISNLIDDLTHEPQVSEEQQQLLSTLSPKEIEVATLVSHGATNKMIAHNMAITERTVKAHLTAIFHKMNISDRLSLAILFRDLR